MPILSGDNGAFPEVVWEGITTSGDDGAFPMGIGQSAGPWTYKYGAIPIDKRVHEHITFTLRGRRPNAQGDDRASVEFVLWKCQMVEEIKLGSGNEVQGIRFRVKAMIDTDGDYGGSPSQPYGLFHTKDKNDL